MKLVTDDLPENGRKNAVWRKYEKDVREFAEGDADTVRVELDDDERELGTTVFAMRLKNTVKHVCPDKVKVHIRKKQIYLSKVGDR